MQHILMLLQLTCGAVAFSPLLIYCFLRLATCSLRVLVVHHNQCFCPDARDRARLVRAVWLSTN